MIMRFDMGDQVRNDMIEIKMLRGETCDIDIWNNNVSLIILRLTRTKNRKSHSSLCFFLHKIMQFFVPQVLYDAIPAPGSGSYVRQVAVAFQPDIALLSNSPIYTISEDGASGTVAFCIKITIRTPDLSQIVNWR